MSKEASKAHAVLHSIIDRAVREGREMTVDFSLSLQDLQNEFEDVNFEAEVNNISLKVRIQTTWDTTEELVPLEEMLGDTEDETEDGPNGDGKSSDSDKKSH